MFSQPVQLNRPPFLNTRDIWGTHGRNVTKLKYPNWKVTVMHYTPYNDTL